MYEINHILELRDKVLLKYSIYFLFLLLKLERWLVFSRVTTLMLAQRLLC